MPKRKVCRLRVFEFLTFFFRSSSLKIFALSTINRSKITEISHREWNCNMQILSLTWCGFSCVVASCIEQVGVQLIFEKLTDWSWLWDSGSTHHIISVAVGWADSIWFWFVHLRSRGLRRKEILLSLSQGVISLSWRHILLLKAKVTPFWNQVKVRI